MADILCKWLNQEVKLSKQVDADAVAREFSSGYLIGELLRKYELQNDFQQFSNSTSTNAKLQNFTRLEPTLRLLEIPFDTVRARDIMTEKQGVAIKLLYELFVALENKRKAQLTGAAMETMRPKAPKVKEEMNREYYQNRLKQLNPRQSEIQLDQLINKWRDHKVRLMENDLKARFEEEEKIRMEQQRKRHEAHQRSKKRQQELNDQVARILAAKVHIPKPPADKTLEGIKARQMRARQMEASNTNKNLQEFEQRLKAMQPVTSEEGDEKKLDEELLAYIKMEAVDPGRPRPSDDVDYIKPRSNSKYVGKIQQRTREDAEAKVEREKRRRKVLVDQLKAHEAQEDARREEEIVNRLMRQSQVERRIVVQLMQTRHEKSVILENRKFREQQYEERRRREFIDAMDVESEMAKKAREEYAEELAEAQRQHDEIKAAREAERYKKHYSFCRQVSLAIVDYSCKFGEYRELTGGLVPNKLFREWTEMFINGVPLYPDIEDGMREETMEDWIDQEREQLLNEADFTEYKLFYGEWTLPEQTSLVKPRDNRILGFIVHRLFTLVYPPPPPPPKPEFQEFPIKIAITGKPFSGKSSVINALCARYGFAQIQVNKLITEAVEAFNLGEVEKLPDEPPSVDQIRAIMSAEQAEKEKAEKELQSKGAASTKDPPAVVETAGASWEAQKPNLSKRANCGRRIFEQLCKGRPVPDEVIAELVVDAIRQVPEGQGWILDDFPLNLEQSQFFEKHLTGLEEKEETLTEKSTKRRSRQPPELVNNPNPAEAPAAPESGLDLLLLVDITDQESLKRAEGRTVAPMAALEYHQEYHPPPEGAATGLSGQEKVEPVEDANYEREQIQKRLVGFEDNWSQIEAWYHRFNVVYSIDGNKEQEEVFYDADRLIQEIFRKIDLKKNPPVPTPEPVELPPAPPTEGDADENATTVAVDTVAVEPSEPPATPVSVEKDAEGAAAEKKGKKGGKKGSAKRGDSAGSDKSGKSGKRSRSGSPKSKAGSGKRSASGGKKKGAEKAKRSPSPVKTPPPAAPADESAADAGPPPPQPGDDDWECVSEPVEQEIAQILAPQWENIEHVYVTGLQFTFKNIRDCREAIIIYLYQIREDFKSYLHRPDAKQEYISKFQLEFNQVPDDTRLDEEMKSEWHEQVFNLQEKLWDISDKRKQDAETERTNIMNDGWLSDKLGILTNDYITVMQVELDKFYDTVQVLKDYYKGMDAAKLKEQIKEADAKAAEGDKGGKAAAPPASDDSSVARLPLLEVPTQEGLTAGPSRASSSAKPASAKKSGRQSADKHKDDHDDHEDKPKIKLIPRRPASADFLPPGSTPAKKDSKKAAAPGGKKGAEQHSDSPLPPNDDDEKILFDAANFVFHTLTAVITAEQAAAEAEEEAERLAALEKEKEKEKAAKAKEKGGAPAGGAKKAGGKGSAGKKGGGPIGKDLAPAEEPSPPPVDEAALEEEKRKALKEKMRQEYIAALNIEEQALRVRVELIKMKGISIIQDVKQKAQSAYTDMDAWLGRRFKNEMVAIDVVCDAISYCVETGSRIQEEIILKQEDFVLHEDRATYREQSPPPRPEPEELPDPVRFTVAQLMKLYQQFQQSAPTSVISTKAFVDIMSDLDSLTEGEEALPECWTSLTLEKLAEVAAVVSPASEFVDWRKFMLALAKPWPQPSQSQLLDLLAVYGNADAAATGFIDYDQYNEVELWFKDESRPCTPEDPNEPFPYPRNAALKELFFHMFADGPAEDPEKLPLLDYMKMLLYFSVDRDNVEGFLRALSVACQTHMPRVADPAMTSRSDATETTGAGKKTPVAPEETQMLDSNLSLEAGSGIGGDRSNSAADAAPESSVPPIDIPETAVDAVVPIDALKLVLQHGKSLEGDSNRFLMGGSGDDETEVFSVSRIEDIYRELGGGSSPEDPIQPLKFTVLYQHPHIQDAIAACFTYKQPDVLPVINVSQPSPDAASNALNETQE